MHDLVNQKKRIFLSGVFACFLTCLICILIATSGCETRPSREYGVFLGINGEETDRLKDYSLAVIEPSEFEAVQIREFLLQTEAVSADLHGGLASERADNQILAVVAVDRKSVV